MHETLGGSAPSWWAPNPWTLALRLQPEGQNAESESRTTRSASRKDELRRMSDVTSSLYVNAQSFSSHPNQCTHIWQINLT